MRSMLFTIIALVLSSTGFAESQVSLGGDSCENADGSIKVSIEALRSTQTNQTSYRSTLEIKDEEIPRVSDSCFITPGVRQVVRCPHALGPGAHAEVYPQFKGSSKTQLQRVFVLTPGQVRVELKNCD